MIYFIGDWLPEANDLNLDGIFTLIDTFDQSEIDYKIIIPKFIPFLRYAWNEHGFFDEKHVVQIADYLRAFKTTMDLPMTAAGLDLANNVEKIYGNSGILLMKNGQSYGKIRFNKYGYVSEVQFFLNGRHKQVDFYSDHGFIYRTDYLDAEGNLTEAHIYSDQGRRMMHIRSEGINIDDNLNGVFEQETYQSFSDIYHEFLRHTLVDFDRRNDQVIVDASKVELVEMLDQVDMQLNIIYLLNDSTFNSLSDDRKKDLLARGQVVVESRHAQRELAKSASGKTHLIPTFPTEINFGTSNTTVKQDIFWQMDQVDDDLVKRTFDYCLKQDTVSLSIEVGVLADVEHFEWLTDRYIVDNFGISFKDMNENLEIELLPKELLKRVGEANSLRNRIKVHFGLPENERLAIIKQARLYVDLTGRPNNYVHALVASTGLPLISTYQSQYLSNGRNGRLIQAGDDVIKAFEYYLEQDSHWNQALVESVSIIEANSITQLSNEWRKLLYEISK